MWHLYIFFKDNVEGKPNWGRPPGWSLAGVDLMLAKFWGLAWKHFNTSLGAEVLEAGLEPRSYVKFDENHTRKLYTHKRHQQPCEPLEPPKEFE